MNPFVVVTWWLALAAPAEPPPTRLADVLREAHQKNPELRAARLRAEAAASAVSPAGALPNPKVMVQLWNAPADFSSVPLMLQLDQELPLGGKRAARRDAASAEHRAAEAGTNTLVSTLDEAVKKAYFELFVAERKQRVDLEIEKTLRSLHEAALARVEAGTGQQVDAIKAQAGEIQASADSDVAAAQARASRARLAALLGRGPGQPFGPTTEPQVLDSVPSVEALGGRALQSRPELAQATAEIAAAEAEVRLARAERVPDLGLMLGGMHAFGGQGQTNFLFAGAQIDLPIFSGSKDGPRIESAQARADAERAMLQGERDRVLAEVAEARALIAADARQIASHHQLIPLEREALQSATHAYVAGRVEFLTVLDSVRDLQMHELELADDLAAYEKHLAELERAVGADLGLVAASEGGHEHADR